MTVSDNFNRADSGSIGGAWTVVQGSWGIAGNQARAPATDNTYSRAVQDHGAADVTISVDIDPALQGVEYGVTFRYVDNNNHLDAFVYRSLLDPDLIDLYLTKTVAGGSAQLDAIPVPDTAGTLTVTCNGPAIVVSYAGEDIAVSDSSHLAATWHGLHAFNNPSIDNYLADIELPVIGYFGLGGLIGFPIEPVSAFIQLFATAGGQSSYSTGAFTPDAADAYVLIVYDHASSTQAVSPSVAGCGLTWTLETSSNTGDPGTRFSVFVGTGTPTAGSIVVTLGHSTGVSCGLGFMGLNNVDPSDPVVGVSRTEGFSATSVTATRAFADAENLGVVFGVVAEQRGPGQLTFADGYSIFSGLMQSAAGTSDNYDLSVALGLADAAGDGQAQMNATISNEWKWIVLVETRHA